MLKQFFVFGSQGDWIATTRWVEEAALVVGSLEAGSTIRSAQEHGAILWTEGSEGQVAAESYDYVCEIVEARLANPRARLAGGA